MDVRLALEEVKFLQKQRERNSGIPALATTSQTATTVAAKLTEKADGDGEKEELVLQDTFAQETAVMVEDPNMYLTYYLLFLYKFIFEVSSSWAVVFVLIKTHRLQYVEQELAKKRGKNIDATDQVETELKRAEDELYKIPEHLKVGSLVLILNISPFTIYVDHAFLCLNFQECSCNVELVVSINLFFFFF